MTKSEALEHYKTRRALARALGVVEHAPNRWDERIPDLQQIRLERLTNYELLADAECWGTAPVTFSEEHLSIFARARRTIRRLLGAS